MLMGAPVSPAGGPANAIERGREKGCRAIQIFNQSPRQWKPTVYSDEQVAAYHEAKRGSRVDALLIHAVYLLNAATTDKQMRDKTLTSLIASLQAGDALGAHAVVLHAGSAKTGQVGPAIKSLPPNDSQPPLGSNRDRHADVAEGELGAAGCAVFLSEPRFDGLPCVMETPGPDKRGPTPEQVQLAKDLRRRGLAKRRRTER